ncbi:MAG: HIT domain-containing protein [Planctomycetota bacterium]|nr:HIT domain-containing protein [Planctomycetota bacterium]
MSTNNDCLFCRIIRREIPAGIIYEDADTLVFRDIKPVAPTHVLVVPKRHVAGLGDCGEPESGLLAAVLLAANAAARLEKLESWRVIFNNGSGAGQTVFHLHAHVIGGTPLGERLI